MRKRNYTEKIYQSVLHLTLDKSGKLKISYR